MTASRQITSEIASSTANSPSSVIYRSKHGRINVATSIPVDLKKRKINQKVGCSFFEGEIECQEWDQWQNGVSRNDLIIERRVNRAVGCTTGGPVRSLSGQTLKKSIKRAQRSRPP